MLDIPVWYNTQTMAKILSLAVVRKKYRVTMDTDIVAAIHIHISDYNTTLYEIPNGLYCYHPDMATSNNSVSAYYFLNTVKYN